MDLYKASPQPAADPGAPREYWQALAEEGLYELIRVPPDPLDARLGYAEPILEPRAGRTVAVAYALGTPEERAEARRQAVREMQCVSPFQARAALANAGLLAAVEALMADPQTPEVARLAWGYATEFRRLSPTVVELAAALGLTEAQLDDLFTVAQGIVA